MKKIIISTILFCVVFCFSANAQQSRMVEAVREPGGTQLLKVTEDSGKITIICGNTNEEIRVKYMKFLASETAVLNPAGKAQQEQLFVPHKAVLLQNGDQEIRWTDAAGK